MFPVLSVKDSNKRILLVLNIFSWDLMFVNFMKNYQAILVVV